MSDDQIFPNTHNLYNYTRAGEKYGIYTLLDMHQDVFSGKFCGEGVPDWAVETGSKRACYRMRYLL